MVDGVDEAAGTGRSEAESAPPGIDVNVPHSARMYDWWLGGKQNYESDRQLGDMFIRAIPTIQRMARENRAFMHRATRWMVEQGIDQFLDIGTGIPTPPNLHETAQEIDPAARVVYVDNDPIVLVHARALMISDERGRTAYIDADLAEPDKILSDPKLLETLDLDRPVGLMLIAVLMLIGDEDDPWSRAKALMDAMPSGSYVAITHPGYDFDPEAMTNIREFAAQGGMTVIPRVRDDVARFFADWELVDPGVVPVSDWHPSVEHADGTTAFYWSGVARKP